MASPSDSSTSWISLAEAVILIRYARDLSRNQIRSQPMITKTASARTSTGEPDDHHEDGLEVEFLVAKVGPEPDESTDAGKALGLRAAISATVAPMGPSSSSTRLPTSSRPHWQPRELGCHAICGRQTDGEDVSHQQHRDERGHREFAVVSAGDRAHRPEDADPVEKRSDTELYASSHINSSIQSKPMPLRLWSCHFLLLGSCKEMGSSDAVPEPQQTTKWYLDLHGGQAQPGTNNVVGLSPDGDGTVVIPDNATFPDDFRIMKPRDMSARGWKARLTSSAQDHSACSCSATQLCRAAANSSCTRSPSRRTPCCRIPTA